MIRLARYAWAAPTTMLGLLAAALTLATGGRAQARAGAIEVYGGFSTWLARRWGFAAMTLGHVILGNDAWALDRCRDHEQIHVRQVERWGIAFIPAYLVASLLAWRAGKHYYRDNWFERDARVRCGEEGCPGAASPAISGGLRGPGTPLTAPRGRRPMLPSSPIPAPHAQTIKAAMSTETLATPSPLPDYLASATPNPPANRAPWYKNTAPTFAGVFLWFVFWDSMSANGLSVGGLLASLAGIAIGALICHFLFYLVPGLLGMKTGLPLYVVGTSTFGTIGGLIMPGFLMGALQFGWLGVNAFASAGFLQKSFDGDQTMFYGLAVVWAALAAFVGLKGIQYVAKVATFLPIIPLVVLIAGLGLYGGSAFSYKPGAAAEGGGLDAMFLMIGAIVGFFGTAGAAGVDFGTNSRDARDVKMGGLIGVVVAILFTAGISVLVVAGARATGAIPEDVNLMTAALDVKLSGGLFKAVMIGLTLASFPGACFSSFIAANSFKTVMPKVNPLVSVGIGTLVSIGLAVSGVAGNLAGVFGIIGASFGPICGAMTADYILNGYRWSGPRAGFNPAGWLAWAIGFFVGVMPNLHGVVPAIPSVPAAPVAAYVVGFVLYFLLYSVGLKSRLVEMPQRIDVA